MSDLLAAPVPTPATPAPTSTDGGDNDGTDSDNKGSVDGETGNLDEDFEFPSVENKLRTFDASLYCLHISRTEISKYLCSTYKCCQI